MGVPQRHSRRQTAGRRPVHRRLGRSFGRRPEEEVRVQKAVQQRQDGYATDDVINYVSVTSTRRDLCGRKAEGLWIFPRPSCFAPSMWEAVSDRRPAQFFPVECLPLWLQVHSLGGDGAILLQDRLKGDGLGFHALTE